MHVAIDELQHEDVLRQKWGKRIERKLTTLVRATPWRPSSGRLQAERCFSLRVAMAVLNLARGTQYERATYSRHRAARAEFERRCI